MNDINLNSYFLEKNDNNILNIEEKRPLKALKEIIREDNIKEKENLKLVLQSIENNLDKEIITEKNINDKPEEKKDIKKEIEYKIKIAFEGNREKTKYMCFLWIIFSIFLPIFISINLIGIFQIISVMNALSEVLKRSVLCYLDWENKEDKSYYDFYNFYSYYFKESINEGIEFDLIETMSFLGTIFVDFYGYKVSSFIFMFLNIISLFLIMNFYSQYNDTFEKYSLLQILYLFFCYVLLFIGVGSSALLSQQLLIDNYEKYTSFYQLKGRNNLFCISITSIIGFLCKYLLDVFISYKKNKFDLNYDTDIYEKDMNITDSEIKMIVYNHDKLLFFFIIIIYAASITISIIIYHFFTYVYEEKYNEKEDEENNNNCKIFGYIFYLDKISNDKQLKPNIIQIKLEEKDGEKDGQKDGEKDGEKNGQEDSQKDEEKDGEQKLISLNDIVGARTYEKNNKKLKSFFIHFI